MATVDWDKIESWLFHDAQTVITSSPFYISTLHFLHLHDTSPLDRLTLCFHGIH